MSEGTRRDRVQLATLRRQQAASGQTYYAGRVSAGVVLYVLPAGGGAMTAYLVDEPEAPTLPEGAS